MKTKVSTVDAMIVDGSRKHKTLCHCKADTDAEVGIWTARIWQRTQTAVEQHYAKNIRIRSGQPAGTKLFTSSLFTKNENADDWQGNSWLEGEGADLFTVGEVERTFNDVRPYRTATTLQVVICWLGVRTSSAMGNPSGHCHKASMI